MKMKSICLFFILFLCLIGNNILGQSSNDAKLELYTDVLKKEGAEPIKFVIDKLNKYNLIIFDDAWHTVVEPFEFYQQLIRNHSFHDKVKYVFLEVFSINKQQHIEAYLNSEPEDKTLLYPAFQDDFSGSGWPLKTYFDLIQVLYTINHTLPEEQRIKVVAVNSPCYWSEIKTVRDVELFRKTLIGNDYTMYKTILAEMDNFNSGRKGIFLTNTRHHQK